MSTIDSIITVAGANINTSAGIVITEFLSDPGNYWLIGESNLLGITYDNELTIDIVDPEASIGYFIPKGYKLILVNSLDAIGGTDSSIGPYNVPFNTTSSFNFFVVSDDDLINARTSTSYPIDVTDPSYPIADEPIFEFTSTGIFALEAPANTLKAIYEYTPEQQKTIANTNEASLRINIRTNETITADVLKDVSNNPILPQFKNFKDYLSYKNSLANRNFLKNKFQ